MNKTDYPTIKDLRPETWTRLASIGLVGAVHGWDGAAPAIQASVVNILLDGPAALLWYQESGTFLTMPAVNEKGEIVVGVAVHVVEPEDKDVGHYEVFGVARDRDLKLNEAERKRMFEFAEADDQIHFEIPEDPDDFENPDTP